MRTDRNSTFGRAVHAAFLLACAGGGMVFVGKLFAFLHTLRSEEMSDFAADPMVVYAFVALGFLFLLGWAFLSGQFSNIEQPKHDMITRFVEQERAENAARAASRTQRNGGLDARA